MPSSSITASTHLSVGFLLLFIIAFFPGLPQFLLGLPIQLCQSYWRSSATTRDIEVSCPTKCIPISYAQSTSSLKMPSGWFQKTFALPPSSRGSYLVTDHVVQNLPELKHYKVGLLNLFVQHTSCALSLNENWDEDVREDMSDALDRIAPEDKKGNLYRHSAEGLDDMPVSCVWRYILMQLTDRTGSHQICVNWRKRHHSNQ